MRAAAYLVMVALLLAAVASGQLVLALAIGGAKALVVGLEFMELRHAARAHAVGFVAWTVAVTGLLVLLT
ncbi:MAG: hypothetical protein ACQEXJ_07210 [Myxococcota bacterium]